MPHCTVGCIYNPYTRMALYSQLELAAPNLSPRADANNVGIFHPEKRRGKLPPKKARPEPQSTVCQRVAHSPMLTATFLHVRRSKPLIALKSIY